MVFLGIGTGTLLIHAAGVWSHAHLKTWSLACEYHLEINVDFFFLSSLVILV